MSFSVIGLLNSKKNVAGRATLEVLYDIKEMLIQNASDFKDAIDQKKFRSVNDFAAIYPILYFTDFLFHLLYESDDPFMPPVQDHPFFCQGNPAVLSFK